MKKSPSERIVELGLVLPLHQNPKRVCIPVLVVDKFLYVSGHGPVKNNGSIIQGWLGDTIDIDGGYLAARQVGFTVLASMITHFGSIDWVKRVAKYWAL